VCQEIFLLVERFQGHPEVAKMLSYRMLHRVLHEQCEVKPAADSVPEEITVKPAREISSKFLQNPADPEAGYSGHKGQGYQVQVMETYCASEDPQVKAQSFRSSRKKSIIICVTMTRRGVLPNAGPTSRPWSFETVTAGGPASKGPCRPMTG